MCGGGVWGWALCSTARSRRCSRKATGRALDAQVERRKSGDDLLGFERDGDDLADESEDVLGVVFAVGVVDDAGARVGGDAVLVDDPFEGGAVAEAVVEGSGGDAAQQKEVVVAQFGFVFGELHLLDAEGHFGGGDSICSSLYSGCFS
jgi:hypothetical protein